MADEQEITNVPAEDEELREEDNPNESKEDKFRRLASNRVNNCLKQLELIGKLSSSAYKYTPEQVEKIFDALQSALDTTKAKFVKTEKKKDAGFSL